MITKYSTLLRAIAGLASTLFPRVSPSLAPVLSCFHYFQAPATKAIRAIVEWFYLSRKIGSRLLIRSITLLFHCFLFVSQLVTIWYYVLHDVSRVNYSRITLLTKQTLHKPGLRSLQIWLIIEVIAENWKYVYPIIQCSTQEVELKISPQGQDGNSEGTVHYHMTVHFLIDYLTSSRSLIQTLFPLSFLATLAIRAFIMSTVTVTTIVMLQARVVKRLCRMISVLCPLWVGYFIP